MPVASESGDRSPIVRGLLDAAFGTLTAWAITEALLLTANASATPYRWLHSHIGWVAAPLVVLLAPALLPLGFILAVLARQWLAALICIVAAAAGKLLFATSLRRRGQGMFDGLPIIFTVTTVWWCIVAARGG